MSATIGAITCLAATSPATMIAAVSVSSGSSHHRTLNTRDQGVGNLCVPSAADRPVLAACWRIFATADHAFSAEQFCTRISPNNAMTLSGNEWLWPAKRA
jgi:hypothetical protein